MYVDAARPTALRLGEAGEQRREPCGSDASQKSAPGAHTNKTLILQIFAFVHGGDYVESAG